MSVHNFPP